MSSVPQILIFDDDLTEDDVPFADHPAAHIGHP
jgi:hypothetical protein